MFQIKNIDKIPTPEPIPEPKPKTKPDLIVFDTAEPTEVPKKSKRKISPLKLSEHFMREIKNYEKYINNEISRKYFGY